MTLPDLLNAPGDFVYGDKTYTLGQPTVLQMGQFARWLEQRARESVLRAVELDDDTRAKLLADVTRDIAAGEYDWGSEACCKALQGVRGQARILAILLADQGVDDDMAEQMIKQRLSDVATLIRAAVTDDPKALREVLVAAGLPSNFVSSNYSTRRSTGRSKKLKGSRKRR